MKPTDEDKENNNVHNNESENRNSRTPQYLTAFAVTLGGFSMGTALSWSSPSLPNLKEDHTFPLEDRDSSDLTWIGSILTVGAAIGTLGSGKGIDSYLGRKGVMLIASVVFVGGWIVMGLSNTVGLLIFGRFLTGLAVGSLSLVAPIYLTEIAQSDIRGVVGVGFQLMAILGCLFSTVVGSLFGWRILSLSCTFVPLLFLAGVLFLLDESPRYLVLRGRMEDAKRSLRWLRDSNSGDNEKKVKEIEDEVQTIRDNISSQSSNPSINLRSRSVLQPILITITLVLFNQLCGVSAVNFYTVDIFKSVKNYEEGSSSSYLSAVIVQLVQVAAVFLTSVLVDRVGRRVLLLTSFGIMASSLGTLGFSFHQFQQNSSIFSCLPLPSLILYNVGYSLGIGSLVWTVMSELLPSPIIGRIYALETSWNWTLAFFITKYFHLLQDTLSTHNTFYLFSALCVVAGISVYLTVPETKGKTLEEIQDKYFNKNKRNAYQNPINQI